VPLSSCKLLLVTVCAFTIAAVAQSKPTKSPSGSSVSVKQYCRADAGFCFSYPANWTVLGEAFGDGVVIAPQQAIARDLWDEVTVAMIVPPPDEGEAGKSINQIIDTAMGNMRASGQNPATLQRWELTVDRLPAQMIKVQYHDEPSGRNWIEQLVFIEGPEQEVYSIALKAQPGTMAKLEPAFDKMVRSWKLQTSSNAASSAAAPAKTASSPQH
jgi:hypothetical protein